MKHFTIALAVRRRHGLLSYALNLISRLRMIRRPTTNERERTNAILAQYINGRSEKTGAVLEKCAQVEIMYFLLENFNLISDIR